AQISGSSHARVHVVVRTDPAQRHRADLAAIERRIAEAALTWADRLREVLAERRGEAAALALAGRYRQAVRLAYQVDVAPAEALAARQVVVLRAFCRYLLRTGVPFSQASMERALGANPGIARNLVRLFEARFQPAAARSRRGGPRGAETLAAQIRSGLDGVSSL